MDKRTGLTLGVTLFALIHMTFGHLQIIDLTNRFGFKTIKWPSNPPFNFSLAYKIFVSDSVVAVSNYFQTAEHSGTHIDAPNHFCVGARAVHELTMDDLSGPGVKLDFRTEANQNSDYEITVDDLQKWEKRNGRIPEKAIVLMQFGWDKYFGDMNAAFKTDNLSDSSSYHFPGLHPDAAAFLARDRKIHAVGGDTPSTDKGQSASFAAHIVLLCDYGKIIIESVGNMDDLPETGSRVFIGALKLENGTGTPSRLFATIGSSSFRFHDNKTLVISLSLVALCLSKMCN